MVTFDSKIQQYVRKRTTEQKYKAGMLGLRVVQSLFKKFPSSKNIDQVLLKVAVLNDLYHTHLTATVKMAEHITSLVDLDELILVGSPLAVLEISNLSIRRTTPLDIYIFATKYCFMSNPQAYFIYDPVVHQQIVKYLNLSSDDSKKLDDYIFFDLQMKRFIKQYKITSSHTDLDSFLWVEGHEKSFYP